MDKQAKLDKCQNALDMIKGFPTKEACIVKYTIENLEVTEKEFVEQSAQAIPDNHQDYVKAMMRFINDSLKNKMRELGYLS